jgi:hypothetical protein
VVVTLEFFFFVLLLVVVVDTHSPPHIIEGTDEGNDG